MIALALFAGLLATPANFPAQLKAAQPGDTVQLVGDFPAPLQIIGRDGLTFDAHGATLVGVLLRASTNIVWSGGAFQPPAGWIGAFYVDRNSKHVVLNDLTTTDTGLANAVTLRDGEDLTLDGLSAQGPKVGVAVSGVTGGVVRRVSVVGELGDGIDVADSHNVLVEAVVCVGSIQQNDRHPDCVQGWSVAGHAPTSDITVRDVMAWGHTQGVTFFDHGAGGFDRIAIERVGVVGAYPDAVYVTGARNSHVSASHAATLPGAQFRATITLDPGIARCGNTVEAGAGKPASADAACAAN